MAKLNLLVLLTSVVFSHQISQQMNLLWKCLTNMNKFDVFLECDKIKELGVKPPDNFVNLSLWVMACPTDVWNRYRKWCRLVILLHEGGENLVKDILGQMGVDVTDGAKIYQKLKPHEKVILKTKPHYLQRTLLPPSKVIDATKLDFSAKCHIIEVLDSKKQFPLIGELRNSRNDLFHMSVNERDMTEQQFTNHWDEISQLLTNFGYDIGILKGLKTDNHLKKEHKKRLDDIEGRVE